MANKSVFYKMKIVIFLFNYKQAQTLTKISKTIKNDQMESDVTEMLIYKV